MSMPIRVTLAALAGLVLATGALGAEPRRVIIDQVALVVNDKMMTERDVRSMRALQAQQLRTAYEGDQLQAQLDSLDDTLMQRLIEDLLLESRAEELGIQISDAQIEERVDAIVRRSPEAAEQYTDEELKDYVYNEMLRRRVLQQEVHSHVRVLEEDLVAACQADARDNREVDVGHILIRGQDEAAREEAVQVRQLLAEGADFTETAVERSQDPSVTDNQGRLGFISRGQFLAPFEERAFAMDVGQVSEPVQTRLGYHLIKVFDERQKEQVDCQNMDDSTRQAYHSRVFNKKSEERFQAFLDRLKESADIRVLMQERDA